MTPAWSCAAATGSPTRCARLPPTRAPGEVVLLAPACASFDAYRGLRGARRALPLPRRAPRRLGPAGRFAPAGREQSRWMTALSLSRLGPRTRRRAGAQPVEYNLLLTATLCLLAFGVVMVFSASSTTSLLGKSGDSAYYLKRTLLFGAGGLLVMRVLSLRGARLVRPLTPLLMAASFFLLLAVLVPGIGMSANGAQRWIGAGLFQIQPSELAKLSLVLYGAHLLAARPQMTRDIRRLVPYLLPVALACLLMVAEPDLGTAIVVCLTTGALLVAAGVKIRHLMLLARRDRRGAAARDRDRALPDAAAHRVPPSHRRPQRRRLPGDPGEDRARLRRDLRRRPRPEPAEGLLPSRGPHGHDRGGDRRGAWAGRDLDAGRAVRAVRLRRAANRAAGARPLRQAARRRASPR